MFFLCTVELAGFVNNYNVFAKHEWMFLKLALVTDKLTFHDWLTEGATFDLLAFELLHTDLAQLDEQLKRRANAFTILE